MKVILYIGHHKVGSTSLQAYLSQNWLALAQAGILYPAVDASGIADTTARGLRQQDLATATNVNIREPHNALAFRMMSTKTSKPIPSYHRPIASLEQMFKNLRTQIDTIAPHTVVICSEVMANFGAVDPKLIDMLKNHLPEAQFEIYCALRRPDQYLASWHGQRLKFGHQVEALSAGAALAYRRGIHFNYQRLIEPWVKCFPEARFHIRNYADVLTAGGSVEDFTQQVDVDFPAELPIPAQRNPSLPYATYDIMRRGNAALAKPDQRMLCNYLLSHRQMDHLPKNHEVELFGPKVRQTLFQSFAPIADYLEQFTPEAAFFPDLEHMLEPHSQSEAEASTRVLHILPLPLRHNILEILARKLLRKKYHKGKTIQFLTTLKRETHPQ